MRRRANQIAVAVASLVAPLTAFAQVRTGTVTTDPVRQAPALGMPLLVVLVVAIAGFAMYRLRRPSMKPIVGLVLFAAVAMLAGSSDAGTGVTISGAECTQRTVSPFPAFLSVQLMSQCPNPIQIVAIDLSCGQPGAPNTDVPIVPDCTLNQILSNGDRCTLPSCAPQP